MKQRHRHLLLLICLVVLPLLLLGWQGWRLLDSDKDVQQARYNQLVEARLLQIDRSIQDYLDSLSDDWQQRLPGWSIAPQALRKRLSDEYRVRHLFLLDAQGTRRFPAEPLSDKERAFVDRLESIWRDPSLLNRSRPDDTAPVLAEPAASAPAEPFSKAFRKPAKLQESIAPRTESGWYMWHWGAGTRLLFWWKSPRGETIGLSLEPTRLKADLIGLLPESDDPGFTFRLRDTSDQIIYQWGGFEAANDDAFHHYPLSYPLSSWTLEFAGEEKAVTSTAGFGLLILLGSLALVLSGLAVYLYREQTRELRQAAQRVEFVSQVSHELKTPLTNIRMYAEMLEEQLDDDPQQQNYLRVIVNESQRLSRLIGNVLNFSRTPTLHLRDVDVDTLVQRTIDHFLPGFSARNIVVKSDLQAWSTIQTDHDMLEQIINNLLSNVEKYAADGKAVDISTSIDDNRLVIRVRDYGPGIPANERKRIFQPFYRIDDRLTEGVSGTGIGLTIARQQAQRLGGELTVEAAKPGACFVLDLPINKEQTT